MRPRSRHWVSHPGFPQSGRWRQGGSECTGGGVLSPPLVRLGTNFQRATIRAETLVWPGTTSVGIGRRAELGLARLSVRSRKPRLLWTAARSPHAVRPALEAPSARRRRRTLVLHLRSRATLPRKCN